MPLIVGLTRPFSGFCCGPFWRISSVLFVPRYACPTVKCHPHKTFLKATEQFFFASRQQGNTMSSPICIASKLEKASSFCVLFTESPVTLHAAWIMRYIFRLLFAANETAQRVLWRLPIFLQTRHANPMRNYSNE